MVWAAVTSSLCEFHRLRTPRQCLLASELLTSGVINCCPQPTPNDCDRQFVLELALRHVRLVVGGAPAQSRLIRLAEALHRGNPVAMGINMGGSFAVIDSCDLDKRTVEVEDPLHGRARDLVFDRLLESYRGLGPWVMTYITSVTLRKGSLMPIRSGVPPTAAYARVDRRPDMARVQPHRSSGPDCGAVTCGRGDDAGRSQLCAAPRRNRGWKVNRAALVAWRIKTTTGRRANCKCPTTEPHTS